MLQDYRDGNKDVISMFRGTDRTHVFQLTEDSGSQFIWNNYTITCEGRLSPANEEADFNFALDHYDVDGVRYGIILFPKDVITGYVRENRISWRVLATTKADSQTKIINYGEILLRDL